MKNIMVRAWEIKKEADRKTLSQISTLERQLRPLKAEEKAIFAECLKMAWAEYRSIKKLAAALAISEDNAARLAEKETELVGENVGTVTWKLWSGYGKVRAYYTCSRWSNYQNSKGHFVNLAA